MFGPGVVLALSALVSLGPDTVVVSPPEYLGALRPWITYRAAQGHRFAFVSNAGSAMQIRGEIRRHAEAGDLKFILLVGDAEPGALLDPRLRARSIPAFMAKAKVNVHWHSTPELATDNWYADLDDDGIPDVAIGRLPADSPQELTVMIAKILAYETKRAAGPWCQRINFVAGIGGFGPLLDPIVELATKKFLTDGIPAAYDTSMTYGSWRSPYCPSPYQFHDATVGRLNEGCLFWVYIGHGYPYQLDRVRVPGRSHHILSVSDMPKLDNRHGAPIAIFLACYTGAYDQPYDCLAEEMLSAPGGPVAVFAGSRVTMPYAMAVLGSGLMHEYFDTRPATLGEIILNAKRQMVDESPQRMDRKLLDFLGRAISPEPQLLAEERREHIYLFNLFGDPLLRMYYPEELKLDVPIKAAAGTYLEIRGVSRFTGECTIELVCRRDQTRTDFRSRRRYDRSPGSLAAYNATYRKANDRRWTVRTVAVESESFLTAIRIPVEAHGACHIRAFLEDKDGQRFALASSDIEITPPKSDTLPVRVSLDDRPANSSSPPRAAVR